MKKIALKIIFILNVFGFNLIKFIYSIKGLNFYFRDYLTLKKQLKTNKEFKFGKFFPILHEKYEDSGVLRGHYFHQDLLVAQKIYKNKPVLHVDIGSRTDGFVAHVASFRKVEVFDIRPLVSKVKNIIFNQSDLMQLQDDLINYCDSLSSLHAIEHFGLGRYGDPIDFEGHFKAINNIHKMLKSNGKFYFSVPIGKQRIEFNAHRVFSVEYLLNHLHDKFIIDNFNYVDDSGDLFTNAPLTKESIQSNFNCKYGCGIFELTKKKDNSAI